MKRRIMQSVCALLFLLVAQRAAAEGNYYVFYSYNGSMAMCEDASGTLTYGTYSTSLKCFWELVSTGNANCYYIRNAVTGDYIQSSKTPGSSAAVQMGSTPVEYYVGENTAVGTGYYYLCSTDNESYATISSANLALNKGTGVVAYASATANKNSYWKMTKSDMLYEVKPFESVTALGTHSYSYTFDADSALTTKSVVLDGENLKMESKQNSAAEAWYFVGSSNTEGYLIASNLYPQRTLNLVDGKYVVSESATPTRWSISPAKVGYYFRPTATRSQAGTALRVDGDSAFVFRLIRSSFSKSAQLYFNPCGTSGSAYFTSVKISGSKVLKTLTYSATSAPSTAFTLFTTDKASVERGGNFQVDYALSATPATAAQVMLYFDINRDGLFETTVKAVASKSGQLVCEVPSTVPYGQTRARIRFDESGVSPMADDDCVGQTIDLILFVVPAQGDDRTVSIATNEDSRGTASLSTVASSYPQGTQLTAKAVAKGSSTFVCWKEGNVVLSTSASYTFSVDHNVDLVAYFAPNMQGEDALGIDVATDDVQSIVYDLVENGSTLTVVTDATVKGVVVYTTDGKQVGQSTSKTVQLAGVPCGTYIVKVFTPKGNGRKKVIIK